MELGFKALELDLTGTRSLDEALDKIRAYAAANPDRKWIVGGGWNQEAVGTRPLSHRRRSRSRGERPAGVAEPRRRPRRLGQQRGA